MVRLSRSHDSIGRRLRRQSESGQIVIEYVLLMVAAIGIALVMTNLMVSRADGQEGFVIKSWRGMVEAIATDKADGID